MDGGVVVQQHGGEQTGFFHMPKIQIPNYQKSRVHIPQNNNFPHAGDGQHTGMADRARQVSGNAPNAVQMNMGTGEVMSVQFDGKRMRKAVVRKTVDYNTSVIKYLENRVWQRDWRDSRAIQPDALYHLDSTPPMDMQHKPMNCLTTKFMRQSTNKFRCPIFCLAWTPEGRRLVTGASSGEFTLWNGLTFSFETILQAHETSVRAMVWSHSDQWMVTGDHEGYIKYWQTNMNNVKMYQGHQVAIRSISFCPTDSKFASCSDDGTVRVWDFLRCYEEKILRGHGADVKCVDWHPTKSLIASGSKDNQVPIKLWDPKSGTSLATLHAHKFTVMDLKWNANGNWLLTAARDHLMKLFDLRNLKEELQVFKGHKKEATSVAWHPINEQMFASGGSDGAIMFWNAGTEKEVGAMEEAHDAIIWDLAWHPMGHVLASASNDHSTKFWSRNRPGDAMRDKYNLNIVAVGPDGEALDIDADVPLGEGRSLLPGMGLEFGLPPPEEEKKPKKPVGFGQEEELPAIPGLDWQADAQYFRDQDKKVEDRPRKKTPYARPIPRSFEQAWITNQQPGTLVKDENDGTMKRGKIQSLLSLEFPDKPPPGLEYVDYDNEDEEGRKVVITKEPNNMGFNPPPEFAAPPPSGNFYEEEEPKPFTPSVPAGDSDYRGDQDYHGDQDYGGDQNYSGDQNFWQEKDIPGDLGRPGDMDYDPYKNESRNEFNFQGQGGIRDQRHEQSPGRGGAGHFRGQFRGGPPVKQTFHGNRNESVGMYEEMDHEGYGNDFNNQQSGPHQSDGDRHGQGFGQKGPGHQGPHGYGGQQEGDRYGNFGSGSQGQHDMHDNSDNFDPSNSMDFDNSGSQGSSQGGQGYDRGRGRGGHGDRGHGGHGDIGLGGQFDRGHGDRGGGGHFDRGRGGHGDRGREGHGDRGRGGNEGNRGRGRGWAQKGGNPNQSFQQEENWSKEGGQGNDDNYNEFQGGRGGYQGGQTRGRGNFRGGDRGSRGGGGRGRGNFRGGGGRGRGRGGRGGN